mgnify:CR=1 FL=1
MSAPDLTTAEILTATSRQRFGAVGKARAAYVIALRLRQSHPGELTERKITDAEAVLRTAYDAEQRDILAAARARALDYASIAINRPRRRA